MMRPRLGCGSCLATVVAVGLGAAPGLAAGVDLRIAPGAWSLEQFGTDVAVLRSSPASDRSGDASLLLACSAEDRRIRVSLPIDLAAGMPVNQRGGSILIAAGGPGRPLGIAVARFRLADANTLVVGTSSRTPDDPVTSLASMLAAGPRNVDLLVSWGSASVVLTRLDVYRLSMRGAAPDKNDVIHFITACRRSTPQ